MTCTHCGFKEALCCQLCSLCYYYRYRNGRLPPEQLLQARKDRAWRAMNRLLEARVA
jgi:hypothetical protein